VSVGSLPLIQSGDSMSFKLVSFQSFLFCFGRVLESAVFVLSLCRLEESFNRSMCCTLGAARVVTLS
jgi:hypothetical protein